MIACLSSRESGRDLEGGRINSYQFFFVATDQTTELVLFTVCADYSCCFVHIISTSQTGITQICFFVLYICSGLLDFCKVCDVQ
jgi:hypothetical protein